MFRISLKTMALVCVHGPWTVAGCKVPAGCRQWKITTLIADSRVFGPKLRLYIRLQRPLLSDQLSTQQFARHYKTATTSTQKISVYECSVKCYLSQMARASRFTNIKVLGPGLRMRLKADSRAAYYTALNSDIKLYKKAQLSLTNPRDVKACRNCFNSACLQRCRWQYWPSFMRLTAIASVIHEIQRNSLKIPTYGVQGHPRSPILVPIESPYVTCC